MIGCGSLLCSLYIARWECVEAGNPYREWLIPARTLNRLTAIIIEASEEHHVWLTKQLDKHRKPSAVQQR